MPESEGRETKRVVRSVIVAAPQRPRYTSGFKVPTNGRLR
jgi:hypothetical protein